MNLDNLDPDYINYINNLDEQDIPDNLETIDKDISVMLDNLPVGIIRLDTGRRCVYANQFILKAFGAVSCSDICKRHHKHIHPEDLQTEMSHTQRFLFENVESETTFRLFHDTYKDYRWVKNKRTLIRANDKITYMYTFQDIHQNKLMEFELRNETMKAEQAYKHKSTFLANMSHEIRTPLNGIIGMLTLLEDTQLNSAQIDSVNMIKECSFNLMTIINDILDYSKLEVGKITLDTRSMSLQECIESTNDIVISKIYEKSLEYTYNINPDVPQSFKGDSNRIKQILLNLISNSIKFTDSGTVFLNIEALKYTDFQFLKRLYGDGESKGNQKNENQKNENQKNDHGNENDNSSDNNSDKLYLRFDITDTGCGIRESEREKLFKSFSQVDNHVTSKIYQGTGLGLAISKELVELMDGCIWLDWSEIYKGSRFSFVISVESSNEVVPCTSNCDGILNGANVLIVDDNLYNRISLTGMITKWGMKAYAFSNSEEALYFTKITHFDLGLIDICMPRLDGTKFAAKLREQTEFHNSVMPLIALSSLGDKTSASHLFKHHLIKPIKEAKLKQVCIDSLRNCIVKEQVSRVISTTIEPALSDSDPELKGEIRILLAEDIYINQRVVVGFLKKLGYKEENIHLVENGQQCLDYAQTNDYDIILLDIRMPVMDGEVALRHLQEYYQLTQKRKPYIVAVTAYSLREDKTKYLKLGFDNYIPKPVSLTELEKCMDSYIKSLLHE